MRYSRTYRKPRPLWQMAIISLAFLVLVALMGTCTISLGESGRIDWVLVALFFGSLAMCLLTIYGAYALGICVAGGGCP